MEESIKTVAVTTTVQFTDLQIVNRLNDIAWELDRSWDELIQIAVFRFIYEFNESVKLFTSKTVSKKLNYEPSNWGNLPELGN